MVARTRLVEDLVADRARDGVARFVILGAGLDAFALRPAQDGDALPVFEVDQPTTQRWKRARMRDLGLPLPGGSQVRALRFRIRAAPGWR
jgi:O-methyltransferase involved in polyketide biosynthesis